MLTEKFDKALQLASELHRGQTRKKTPVPYMSHLMTVSGIVLEANAYHQFDDIEDLAIAALLHDAIEDQGHKISLAEIRRQFGDRVHDVVEDCSDAIVEEENQEKPPWHERKKAYVANLKSKSKETIIVSSADKLHNARCIMFDYDRIGDEVWNRFSAGRQDTLWYYVSLNEAFREAWPENPLLPEFHATVNRMRKAVSAETAPKQ